MNSQISVELNRIKKMKFEIALDNDILEIQNYANKHFENSSKWPIKKIDTHTHTRKKESFGIGI